MVFDVENGLEGLDRDLVHQILNELNDIKIIQTVYFERLYMFLVDRYELPNVLILKTQTFF
jgi:hypothetical protein